MVGLIFTGYGRIYLVRLALRTYYDYRTSTVQGQLDDLEKQRNETIERLKNATKYNSTQELLKKYGGTPTPKDKPARKPEGKSPTQQNKSNMPQNDRTNIAPPPTANIPGRIHVPSPQGTPQHFPPQKMSSPQSQSPRNWQGPVSPQEPGEDFAPNAFAAPLQYAQAQEGPRWYDRLMDVLMGEDESLPGKRLALICKNCRLVNGQAPPGVLRLEDVGKWRCAGCGTTNGEESEVRKLVASMKDETPLEEVPHATSSKTEEKEDAEDEDSESDVTQYSSEEERAKKPAAEAETPRRRSTRVKKSIQEAD